MIFSKLFFLFGLFIGILIGFGLASFFYQSRYLKLAREYQEFMKSLRQSVHEVRNVLELSRGKN